MPLPDNLRSLIIFEDDAFLAVNKPAGLLSIPDGYHPEFPHLAQVLFPTFGWIWIVHRLDRETSGVILVARSRSSHQALNQQFQQRLVKKRYLALIQGNPDWETISVNTPLRVNGDRKHRTIPAPLTGKPAQSDFFVREQLKQVCLIEAQPHTGYTHQIRAHLASIGHPILGDTLYSSLRPDVPVLIPQSTQIPRAIDRVALHAFSITFHHPLTNAPITIEAPYPGDFSHAIDAFRL